MKTYGSLLQRLGQIVLASTEQQKARSWGVSRTDVPKKQQAKLHLVNHAVKTVEMQMHICDPKDRVWSLPRTYSEALMAGGYGVVKESKPHIAIQHFYRRLKFVQLYHRMVDIMNWRVNENFHCEEFDLFVREVAFQARKIQSEERHVPPT